jgi:hypothetical protein
VQLGFGNETALATEVTETLLQALKRDPRIDGSYARLKACSTHRLYTRCETAIAQHAAEGGVLGRGKIKESLQGRHNSHTLPGSQLFCKARSAPLLPALQFVEHGFHLRQGVLIPCTTRAFDALLQQ